MQRFSVSLDEDLASWVKSQADERGVSKAKMVRDSVATARVTGLVQSNASEQQETGKILDRLESLETRVSTLEQAPPEMTGNPSVETEDIVSTFREHLSDKPPRTEHGEQAVVQVFSLLLEDGPLRARELKKRLYPELEDKFSTPDSMWESIRRHFSEIPGIEQIGRGKYDSVPEQVRQN